MNRRFARAALLPLLCLSACVPGNSLGPINGKEFLKTELDKTGPEIAGVNATLENNANVALENGDFVRAAQFYQQLVDSDRENMKYKLKLAEARRRGGDLDTSIGLYDAVLKKEPENLDEMEGKALALMYQGEFDPSLSIFSEIMKKDKTRWRTLNALGILFVRQERYDDAMAYYKEALKFSKNNVAVLNNVGLTHAISGNHVDAIEALREASRLTPDKSGMRKHVDMNLALVYGVSGDTDQAEKIAGRYYNGAALDNNLGLYAYLAKNPKLAKDYFNMALSTSPYYYQRAWENLARVDDAEDISPKKAPTQGKRIKIK